MTYRKIAAKAWQRTELARVPAVASSLLVSVGAVFFLAGLGWIGRRDFFHDVLTFVGAYVAVTLVFFARSFFVVLTEAIRAPTSSPITAKVTIGASGEELPEARVYELDDIQAKCVRLVGAEDEEFPERMVEYSWAQKNYELPQEFQSEREEILARLQQDAREHKSPFYNGPCVRLESYHAKPLDSSEEKHLTLYVDPLQFYDQAVSHEFVDSMLKGKSPHKPSQFIDLHRLERGDISHIKLATVLGTVTTLCTADGVVLIAKRGIWLSTRRDHYSASVDEAVHREKDTINGKLNVFNTSLRGIEEEVSPELRKMLSEDAPHLLGISFGLDELHPKLLFSVFLPLPYEEMTEVMRRSPGRDFQEGHLISIPADENWAALRRALRREPWIEGGKACLIRATEFVDAQCRKRGETMLTAIKRLSKKSATVG
jgi:hypothetical protein